jgi:hypothetical protein
MFLVHFFIPKVVVPKMTAAEAVALVGALQSAHRAQQGAGACVPDNVTGCMKRLGSAGEALVASRQRGAKRDQNEAQAQANRAQRRQVFRSYKQAWSSTYAQVGVWRGTGRLAKLPETSREPLEQLFPAGVTALAHGRALAVHTVGAERLGAMQSEGVVATFRELGGADVLAHLQRVHQDFSDSLGVSAASAKSVAATAPESPEVAPALAQVRKLLGEYALKVCAMIDPEAPGLETVAYTLLEPLHDAIRKSSRRSAQNKSARKAPAKPVTKPAAKPAAKPAEAPAVVVQQPPANDTTPALRPTGTADR